jgi:hypothetical protein
MILIEETLQGSCFLFRNLKGLVRVVLAGLAMHPSRWRTKQVKLEIHACLHSAVLIAPIHRHGLRYHRNTSIVL